MIDLLEGSVPLESNTYFGIYSAASVRAGNRTSIYLTPDGREIEVSLVLTDLSDHCWQDAVNLGPVTKWVRVGRARVGNSKEASE